MRWEEFVQDDKGALSSTRLGLIASVFGLIITLWIMAAFGRPEIGIVAGALASLVATAFVGGKMSADSVVKTQMQTSSPPPLPPVSP